MNLKNSTLKAMIFVPWIGSFILAILHPSQPKFGNAHQQETTSFLADSIPYYSMMRQLLHELNDDSVFSTASFLQAFTNKDFDSTGKMLYVLGSQLQSNIEDKGLYCFLLGAYYKTKPNNDKKFIEEIPVELFYLGSLYCNDANPYCDNLFKKLKLPEISIILNKKPPYYRVEKLKRDYKALNKTNQTSLSIDEIYDIFPFLDLHKYANKVTLPINEKINSTGEENIEESSKSQKLNNKTHNEAVVDKPRTYKTAEEKYDFLKDYDPKVESQNQPDEKSEITQEDMLDDQKKRYEQLHEIIVQYFKTNAHERNIRADCYRINSGRINSSNIGLKVRLTAYEDADYCKMTPQMAEALTDCLIGALRRHEKITATKFENASTSITIYCLKGNIQSASIAEKFGDLGIPLKDITQKNGDFSIEFFSLDYYNEELNRLNKKIQDYKKSNRKN